MRRPTHARSGFASWRRARPFAGGVLTVLAGVELFFSGQLDIGNIHVQLGIEGFQATIIPVLLVLLGMLAVLMPVHRIFYGVISLAVSVYSLIGVNLGGFLVGMLLGAIGGVLIVSWMPRVAGCGGRTGPFSPRPVVTDDSAPLRRPPVPARSERHAIAVVLCVALCGIGAAPVPGRPPSALCLPILMRCSPPTSSPAPTPGPIDPAPGPVDSLPFVPGPLVPLPGPTIPLPGLPGAPPAAEQTPDATGTPIAAVPDEGAPVFTLPAAQLGGSSISIAGLRSVTVVTVPLANGTRTPVLKLVADDVAITDFLLDVRKATGPSLVTTADRMELRGNVQVYLDSLTATLPDGTPLTFGAATPPPGDELPSTLFRINLGLVGVTADSIVFAAPHQDLKE